MLFRILPNGSINAMFVCLFFFSRQCVDAIENSASVKEKK